MGQEQTRVSPSGGLPSQGSQVPWGSDTSRGLVPWAWLSGASARKRSLLGKVATAGGLAVGGVRVLRRERLHSRAGEVRILRRGRLTGGG